MNLLNLGDCWQGGYYHVNSKDFEQAVLSWYARLWHLDEAWWGYMTAMGSTEGNLYALFAARDYLQQRHSRPPLLLSSTQSHYSIHKAGHLLQLKTPAQNGEALGAGPLPDGKWPSLLPCHDNGRIDHDYLMQVVDALHERDQPMIISLTLGTTFTGISDDWRRLADALLERYGAGIADKIWLHLDGALGANFLALSKDPGVQALAPDFRHPLLNSVCVSPYKWLGLPMPVGLVLTREAYQAKLPQTADYTGSIDTTIAGSRPGISAVLLWEQLSRRGLRGQQQLLERLQGRLADFHEAMTDVCSLQDPSGRLLQVRPLEPGSPMAVFSAPNLQICREFSLSCSEVMLDGRPQRMSHVVVLEHVSRLVLEKLLDALRQPGAFQQIVQ
jgi:histidine decarboxylase